jgi:membrane associated rhomboid family serine protease
MNLSKDKFNFVITMSILFAIIVITCISSVNAFGNRDYLHRWMFSPYDVKHHQKYLTIVMHQLIHADYLHLIFNMLSLYFLGSILESQWIMESGRVTGEVHFLMLYIFGGVFATILPYMRNQDNPNYRSLGASGAVSAVIFASIVWNPTMELMIIFLPIPIPAYLFGPIYLAFEYWADKKNTSGIAHDAHIGGALFGIIFALFINIDKGKQFLDLLF